MSQLKPKEWHEQHIADIDKAKIVQYLSSGQDIAITKISVNLARECDLFVHFQRLWKLRVASLDKGLSTDEYMKNIYVNRRTLYKELSKSTSVKAEVA
jgi:hypothetical protein